MKNIADVNSDDILSELNSLDYGEDDLKLLDDEDIKPIKKVEMDDDLRDFYSDVKVESPKIDLYTEKEVKSEKTYDSYIKEDKPKKIDVVNKTEEVKESKEEKIASNISNIDMYLNRQNEITAAQVKHPEPVISPVKPPEPVITPVKQKVEEVRPIITSQVEEIKPNIVAKTEDKIAPSELNQLFDRVSNNVRGASEIVNKNAEIKRKIEAKFDELRKLQQEHEENKRKDYEEINKYKTQIDEYKITHPKNPLEDPINLKSEKQLSVLFYDIIGYKTKAGKGTGREILQEINDPLTKALLELRTLTKLIDAFIVSLPGFIEPTTGRIHTNLNQDGTETGRFSSSKPNLQQIPARNPIGKKIRQLFKASPGYVMMSSDFS